MHSTGKIATVFGGNGFVGKYVARRLARDGWRVRVACRRPNEALFVRTYGSVGQVEPIFANIRDDASTRAAIAGADVVINCVSVLCENGRQTFRALNADGAARIARIASEENAARLVHISALGADKDSASVSARSKAEGEERVLAAFPNAVILRPSVIFGAEDTFFNRFAAMVRFAPVLPLVGAGSRFQPVYVDDVAAAAVAGATQDAAGGIYELGGPDTATFRQLMQEMLGIIRRRRLIVNVPFWAARIVAGALDMGAAVTLGLVDNKVLTRDQVKQLANDNVVSDGAQTLADLGIAATPMDTVLESYLYCHRASGQYAAVKESAGKLRT